jgi:hypothetical protein
MKFLRIHKKFVIPAVCVFAFAGFALLLLPPKAVGISEYMFRLPTYSKFQCTLCHTVSRPVRGNAPLNPFGDDFKANGDIWSRTLAEMNSDGDKCTNGFELNDMNGDGIPDEPGVSENSNPGTPDCSITLTRQTWGIIKELFSGD